MATVMTDCRGKELRLRFCDAGCRANYREDRRAGLMYGGYAIPVGEGGAYVNVGWERGVAWANECGYCRADVTPGVRGRRIYPEPKRRG